jgi:hypothetical protein
MSVSVYLFVLFCVYVAGSRWAETRSSEYTINELIKAATVQQETVEPWMDGCMDWVGGRAGGRSVGPTDRPTDI